MSVHLKQDKPDNRNVLDTMVQGVIGADLPRPEGLMKVTGTATYAAEYDAEGLLEGVLVTVPIVRGEITMIDEASVLGMPCVVAVLSDARMTGRPAQGMAGEAPFQPARQVCYWGQPVALVVAASFEQARDAAKHLRLEWRAEDAPLDPTTAETEENESTRVGDLAHAMAEAAHSVDVVITTEGHASAAMEPHAALAQWDGKVLTVHASLQMLKFNRAELADSLNLDESQVRLLSPYVGGGFGSKLGVSQKSSPPPRRDTTGTPGPGGDEPPAGVPNDHAPLRDAPAHPACGRCRWQAHRLRTRGTSLEPARRGLRRTGAAIEPVPLRW